MGAMKRQMASHLLKPRILEDKHLLSWRHVGQATNPGKKKFANLLQWFCIKNGNDFLGGTTFMKQTKLIVSLLLVGVAFGFGLSAIGGSGSGLRTSNEPLPNVLRVGVSPTYPPIIFNQRGLISGVEADLANALATFLTRPLQFVEFDWIDQIPALLDNKIDIIMSGMSKTKKREEEIAFTIPYYRLGQLPLVRRRDLKRYNTWRSIFFTEGKIGVVRGTTGELLVDREIPRAIKIPFYSGEDAAKALIMDQVEMVVYDAPFIQWVARDHADQKIAALSFSPLSEEFLAWGIRKGDVELLESANKFMQAYEESGKLERILSKWIPN